MQKVPHDSTKVHVNPGWFQGHPLFQICAMGPIFHKLKNPH